MPSIFFHNDFLAHEPRNYPEAPERLAAVRAQLVEKGLWEAFDHPPVPLATLEDLLRVHQPRYLNDLQAFCGRGGGHLAIDTLVNADSYRAACRAAGAVQAAIKALSSGSGPGLVLARPPGHHAGSRLAMGFCLINNVAVGARYAQSEAGLRRIAIVDWDLHHGNGTESIFYDDPSVLYISLHESPAYPGTGWLSDIGVGQGEGYTVNIPLPSGTGDRGILKAFATLIRPMLQQFQPELILVSAGFDGHHLDFMGSLNFTARGYYQLTRQLMELAGPQRLVLVLEGGYHLTGLAQSVAAVGQALLGRELTVSDQAPWEDAGAQLGQRLDDLRQILSPYWSL
ncbi:MAG: histone deacetylase [Bacillota bacterium]